MATEGPISSLGKTFPGELLRRYREFPGSRILSRLISLARKFGAWLWFRSRSSAISAIGFQNLDLSSESGRGRRGRPTIPDNFLLGSRNHWLFFFQEYWHELGWPLLQIRKRRGSTIEDVRKLFEPLSGRPNCHLVEVFLRGSPQEASRAELRSNRIRSNDLHYQIQRLQSERPQLQLSRLEAERALKQASTENAENIQAEAKRRKEGLEQLEESIKGAESESRDLDKKVCDQEAYRYCSELLDFLQSRSGARNPSARSALNPLNLANALAGLPEMGWRQSYNRCSRLPEERYKHQHFQVFEIISQIWDRRPEDFEDAPVGFFRTELLKLHKKDEGTRILLEKWRDLRIAIEECWNQKHSADFMPHAITAAFFKNLYREKNDADKVMDAQERLLPG